MKKAIRKKLLFLICIAIVLVAVNIGQRFYVSAQENSVLCEGTEVHVIDVGQGDAILILSGKEAVLVDAGPVDATSRLMEYLNQQKVARLRAIIATHPHHDHIGGMPTVLSRFPVDELIMNNQTHTTADYRSLLQILEEKEIPITVPKTGDTLTLESGAKLTFFVPNSDTVFDSMNNYSIITRVDFNGESMLLTADAEKEEEALLLQTGVDIACDYLKVGHHGANTSSTAAFLAAVHPQTAIISVGAGNNYGHPNQEVLDRLAAAGVTDIRRTDKEGNVVISLGKQHTQQADAENAA